MTKILLLSVSAGAGHTRAAQALEAYARTQFEGLDVLHIDVMDYVPVSFRKIYVDTYLKLVEYAPMLWGALYKRMASLSPEALTQRLRRGMERLNTRALGKVLKSFQPDAVICTHFLPAEILMHKIANAEWSRPVWLQITDFDLHGMWVMPHLSGYFASNPEVAFRLSENGIDQAHIHVTGIPIMPGFSRDFDKKACREALGLDPHKTVLLLMGGGAGLGGMDEIAAGMLQQDEDFQLIALAGSNEEALASLQTLAARYPGKLFPKGFTREVEQLMGCADLIVTKPGGLTSSECLAMGLPMIVHAPIPGQEEHNADYLMEHGAALKAYDALGLAYRVRQLMQSPQQLEIMKTCARSIAKPFAARDVLHTVLASLPDNAETK